MPILNVFWVIHLKFKGFFCCFRKLILSNLDKLHNFNI